MKAFCAYLPVVSLGEIARIKMVDGIVVSQLYPVHHERCKPIRLVEARAKEIERRCRKDIIQGMNPKEAWKKVTVFVRTLVLLKARLFEKVLHSSLRT